MTAPFSVVDLAVTGGMKRRIVPLRTILEHDILFEVMW